MKRIFLVAVLIFQLCCHLSSQQMVNSHQSSDADSIQYYQEIGNYKFANRLIKKAIHSDLDMSAQDEIHLWVMLFSNQMSLRTYDDALITSAKLDSLIAKGISTNHDAEELGLFYHKKGVLHYRLREAKKAIQAYQMAIKYRINATSESDLTVVKSLKNLGHAFYDDRNLNEAVKAFTRSINNHLLGKERDELMLQQTYSFLSNTYIEMDDMEQGLKYLNSSIILAKDLYGEESIDIAELYSSDVVQYYNGIGDSDEMLAACEKAESILKKLDQSENVVQDILSNTYNNRAVAHQKMGNNDRAVKNFLKSSEINKARTDRIYYLIDNYLNLGSLFIDSKQFDKANHYFSLVKTSLSPDIDSIAFGLYYYHQAELERHEKKYVESEVNFINALKYFNAYDDVNTGKIKNGLPSYLEVLFDYAMLFSDQYQEGGELNSLYLYDSIYSKIDLGIQAIRKDFKSQESKVFLSSKVKDIYDHSMDVFYTLFEKTNNIHYAGRCFEVIEKNKALAILENLVNRQSLINSAIPESELLKIENLEKEILDLSFLDNTKKDSKELKELIIQAELNLENLLNDVSAKYPEYSTMIGRSETISLDKIRHLLQEDNCAAIQYYLTEGYLYIMYLSQDELYFKRLVVNSGFSKNVFLLRELINQSSDKVKYDSATRDKLYTDFLVKSKDLYQLLIQPIEAKIGQTKKLIIAPDKQIGYIPFDVLSSSGSEEDYLIHNNNISYAYSLSMHEHMLEKSHVTNNNLILGFAPSFSSTSELSALPFNTTEVKKINEIIEVSDFINQEANKTNFLNHYQDYGIIHLSTHGIINEAKPAYSYIAFSEVSDSSHLLNSLYANEIFNLNSNAELLVLSACETAVGEIANGEGIMSLSRAWASTGIKSIVSTLWKIDDQCASELMYQFYKGLNNSQEKSTALWNAKKNIMTNDVYKHPYYWSAFTLMGDTSRLNQTNSFFNSKRSLLALSGLVFLCLLLWMFKRRTKVGTG